jgi:GT2 family glycosyltransferase
LIPFVSFVVKYYLICLILINIFFVFFNRINNTYKVSVVILNYNGKSWLEKFLPNVIQHTTYPNAEIIVADNASTDDSVAFLQTNFPTIRLVINPINTGYAGGYNDALQQIESDYYVLLNSDVEVTPNWIENVLSFMSRRQTNGSLPAKNSILFRKK